MARILFVACDYYIYTERIENEMRRQGHDVVRVPIEPHGTWNKAVRKYAPGRHRRMLDVHHAKVLDPLQGQRFDMVVFLQAHQISPKNLRKLRAEHADARFILYNWDSVETHDYRPQLPMFDKAATFDPVDARAYNIQYLPLFALPEFYSVPATRLDTRFDIYFVGSMHSLARAEAVQRLYRFCAAEGLRLKLHLHCSPPRFAQLLLKRMWLPGMTLRSIRTEGIIDIMRRSVAVFDFASQRQTGMTMRVFENVAAGMKIIATNPYMAGEPFATPDRVLMLNELDFAPTRAFLEQPLAATRRFEEYSLSNWLPQLLA